MLLPADELLLLALRNCQRQLRAIEARLEHEPSHFEPELKTLLIELDQLANKLGCDFIHDEDTVTGKVTALSLTIAPPPSLLPTRPGRAPRTETCDSEEETQPGDFTGEKTKRFRYGPARRRRSTLPRDRRIG